MISAGHYLAALAGDRIFARGGNAVDAGIAAAVCLNVVEPDFTNFGGVAPMIVHEAASGRTWQVSGLGCFPRRASIEFFMQHCGGDLPVGIMTTVVPAAPDAYLTVLDRFGTLTFREVVAPALELAETGFPVYPVLRENLIALKPRMCRFRSSREIFFPGGDVPEIGATLVQTDIANLFRSLVRAEQGAAGDRHAGLEAARELFYKGDIAERITQFIREQGGLLEVSDMAAFHVDVDPALTIRFRGVDVYSCGPWCQGPVLLQTLGILESLDLGPAGWTDANTLHTIVEAMKLAFADREAYYGDPKFVDVPINDLLSLEYGRRQAARIDARRALLDPELPGGLHRGQSPRRSVPVADSGRSATTTDTSYVCAIDTEGNGFSCTPSDGVGNTAIVPGLGIIASDRGHSAWLDPGHPSCVAPGKRPRLTPNPALAIQRGRMLMTFGSPGGDIQPQAMLQSLLNVLLFGMNPQQAIEAPRVATHSFPSTFFPHRSDPGSLLAESRIPTAVLANLRDRGHRVKMWPDWHPEAGAVCMVTLEEPGGVLTGAADPRRNNYAIGW
jgi:gamma-glutamyltranspeptidase/glutathione hydrolase